MRRHPWYRIRIAVRLLVALALAIASTPAQAQPKLRVDFISVGQGDAALIISPTGKRVLIDGGPPEAGAALAAFVRATGTPPLDLVLLSHRHTDHLGGIAAVIRAVGTRMFMDAPFPHRSPAYTSLLRLLVEDKIPVRQAERGRMIDLGGGATLTLLSPPEPPLLGTRSDVNSNSVIVRLAFGRTSVLFAGDAEAPTEAWLIASGANLRATVLKVPHHGGHYSSTANFLRAVAPEIAVISAGAGNSYGHPAPATLARLQQIGARVYRTDKDGHVTVESDGARVEVHTAQSQEPRRTR